MDSWFWYAILLYNAHAIMLIAIVQSHVQKSVACAAAFVRTALYLSLALDFGLA